MNKINMAKIIPSGPLGGGVVNSLSCYCSVFQLVASQAHVPITATKTGLSQILSQVALNFVTN